MKLRRWLYLVHRWLGVGMCLLLAMWFFSGVVMMYVGFPELTRSERLQSLPSLQADSIGVGPDKLLSTLPPTASVTSLRLTSVTGRPAWLLGDGEGAIHGQFADTGELVNRLTAKGRVQRWLYNGLHSLDFPFLVDNRPLWDLVVVALSIAGFVFAVTSVVIGWRRLKPGRRRRPRTFSTAPSRRNAL